MELINKLQQIGLTLREAEIYVALLQKKDFTSHELARFTTITRTKIYEILQSLVRKGVCNESYRDGLKVFKGIKPDLALQNIIMHFEDEMEQKKKTAIDIMKDVAVSLEKELSSIHRKNQNDKGPMDYIEVLTDLGHIRQRWFNIQKNTKKEILAFSKPPYTLPKITDNRENEIEMADRKIQLRGIYEYGQSGNKSEFKYIAEVAEEYQKIGEKVKIVEELPMKLLISDETVTMLGLHDRVSLEPTITTIVVDHPSFAKAQKAVFEAYWDKGLSVREFKKMKRL